MIRLEPNNPNPTVLNLNKLLSGWLSFSKTIDAGQAAIAAAIKTHAGTLLGDQPWAYYMFMSVTIVQSALIVLGNTPQVSAWLLALLMVGIGAGLLLPMSLGGLSGFAVVILWVTFRQTSGLWADGDSIINVVEGIGLMASVILAIRVRLSWLRQQEELQSLRALQNVIKSGEGSVGLLPLAVAELRLLEETDRAKRFQRPLGLLLIEYGPHANQTVSVADLREIEKAIIRKLATALVHDIPFRMAQSRVGLIMPERTWEELYEEADRFVAALDNSSFIDQWGQTEPVRHYVRIHVGLGAYQGQPNAAVDLMQAAQDSLTIGSELTDLGGPQSIPAYVLPATRMVDQATAAKTNGDA